MITAQEIVQNLNDNQAVMMANKINDKIFSNVEFDIIERGIKDDNVGKTLLGLSDDQLKIELNANISVDLSREILESMAKDENLSMLITDVWREVQEHDSMFVGTAIAIGLIANLTLFMISSEFELEIGGVKLRKHTIDTEAVKAIMEPITEAIRKF